jgi:glycosyltransferase involved in cell wall biosynthesis
MRIGLVVECDAPFVSEEVRWLRRLGLDVRVASVFRPLPAERWMQAFEGPVDYPEPGRTRWAARLLRDAACSRDGFGAVLHHAVSERAPLRLVALAAGLARRARAEGWRHLHASFATFPAWTAWAAGRLAGLPFSFTAHAYDVQEPRPWLGRLAREASFVRAISHDGAQGLRAAAGCAPERVRVGHLGVDVERFRPAPVSRRQRAEPPEVVCVARLGPTKGIEVLIDAAARVAADGTPFRLRIVGDGPLRRALMERARARGIEARVRLEGAAGHDGVAAILGGAALFALPCVATAGGRRHDGLPVSLLEAMACALPVISTPIGGIREAVTHDRDGWLVAPGDPEALAAGLRTLLGSPALRARLGAEARQTVVQRFDGRAAAARLEGWIRA